jgi:hypothetical protein
LLKGKSYIEEKEEETGVATAAKNPIEFGNPNFETVATTGGGNDGDVGTEEENEADLKDIDRVKDEETKLAAIPIGALIIFDDLFARNHTKDEQILATNQLSELLLQNSHHLNISVFCVIHSISQQSGAVGTFFKKVKSSFDGYVVFENSSSEIKNLFQVINNNNNNDDDDDDDDKAALFFIHGKKTKKGKEKILINFD